MNKRFSIFLAPLALLYGIGITLRHLLYRLHVLRSHEVSVPTVCVGNLAVGGTGKTPHVEWLIEHLGKQYKVAVLSRGYKRRSHGFQLADADSTAMQLGDECMQLHSKFPDVPMAVCANRVEGIRRLCRLHPDIDVVLLDDAYQHLRLRCGFYILLTTADNLYVDDHLLPWGRLRDLRSQSLKANAVIVTQCPPTMTAIDRRILINHLPLPAYQSLFMSQTVYVPFDESIRQLPTNSRVLLLAGIARPHYLQAYLSERFSRLTSLLYPDHHAYTKRDLKKIEEAARPAAVVFTTEKDYARLQSLPLSEQLRGKLYPVRISVQLSDESLLLEQLNHYIKTCI